MVGEMKQGKTVKGLQATRFKRDNVTNVERYGRVVNNIIY
jgi:hypothetical protein